VLKIDLLDTCLFIPAYKAGLSRQDSGKYEAKFLLPSPNIYFGMGGI
jgi:hypothetical protein